jgi:hypothetical protein
MPRERESFKPSSNRASGIQASGITHNCCDRKGYFRELKNEKRTQNFRWLADEVKRIVKLGGREIEGTAFFYIPPDRAKFWPEAANPHAFELAVSERFPSASFEITSAAISLAVGLDSH